MFGETPDKAVVCAGANLVIMWDSKTMIRRLCIRGGIFTAGRHFGIVIFV